MYCDQCGREIEHNSRFCRHCGASQTSSAEHSRAEPRNQPEQVVWRPAVSASGTGPVQPKTAVGRTLGIIVAAILLLIVVGRCSSASDPTNATAGDDAATLTASSNNEADNVAAIDGDPVKPTPEEADPWTYHTDADKIRGATTYFASTTSSNTIHQNSPYDDNTSMKITVRKSPAYGTDVVLTISSGQMMCPSYEGCSGTVRFDNGPAERISFNGPADDSSDTVFVKGAFSFISKLKKAKTVVIEKTLYEAGSPQFEFDVHGLKWSH